MRIGLADEKESKRSQEQSSWHGEGATLSVILQDEEEICSGFRLMRGWAEVNQFAGTCRIIRTSGGSTVLSVYIPRPHFNFVLTSW